jgi:aryl-alcohol dehydrogenase-like predicted oxidoreductase
LEYVKLQNTDFTISKLGFGCEPAGGTDWGKVDDRDSIAAIREAVEQGINFFDTADVYGLGRSERILSEALGSARHDVVIATKFGVGWREVPGGRAKTFFDSSPERVVAALEASLGRLKLDCIPLYYIHWPDPHTPIRDTMEALNKCRRAGKIRAIGVSNFSPTQIRDALEAGPIACVQTSYNLIQRNAEATILPYCDDLGLGVIAYGPLAQGLLTGKYTADSLFGPDDRRSRLEHFQKETLAQNLAIVDRLKSISQKYQKSPAQVAIRWILDNPRITAAIVGIKNRKQLQENLAAVDWTLRLEDREVL